MPPASAGKPPDVEAGKKDSQGVFNKDDAEDLVAHRARCALQVVHLCLLVGALTTGVWGAAYMVQSNYTPPPLPAAYVVGQILVVPATALALASAATLGAVLGVYKSCTPDNTRTVTRASFSLVWGLAIAAFAVLRFWLPHPHTLSACPCPPYHARLNSTCVPCPGFEKGVCEDADCVCGDTGVCSETTAQCTCDANWQVGSNGTCAECSSRAIDGPGGACSRCSPRFKPDARGDCTVCRNGYVNGPAGACSQCHPHFAPRVDDTGTIVLTENGAQICSPVGGCVDDQRVGPMCTPVAEPCDAHGDVGAQLANANNLMVAPFTFTTTGQVCAYDHDCPSYNCLGWCVDGALPGTLCQENADCPGGGTGQSRTCGAEYRVGDDTCRCSRAGYLAPRCEKCPGFNGAWSASTCGGRGTCAAVFVDGTGRGFLDTYSHLECVCAKPAGVLTEFPKWSGDKCARAVQNDGTTAFCAEGFFGPQCDVTCPAEGGPNSASAWGGIGACDSRGVCEYDGNTAQCVCDRDARPNGDGFFFGETCTQCFDQFYGRNCQSCPKLSRVGSCDDKPPQFLLFTNPDQCFASCTTGKTCDDGKTGTGMCLS